MSSEAATEIVDYIRSIGLQEVIRNESHMRVIAKIIDRHAQAAQPAEPAPPSTTERRELAKQLLQGLLASPNEIKEQPSSVGYNAAGIALLYADALLDALDKGK